MTLASRRKTIKWGKNAFHGSGNPNFTGGAYIDDKGYIRVLRPEHPHNNKRYIYAHRLVMEKFLGRYLEPWETVHHINELKLDNRLDNLYLCTQSEHSLIHKSGKKKSLDDKTNMRNKTKARGKRERNSTGQFLAE